MRYAVVQLFIFTLFCVTDISSAIYRHSNDQIHDQVGYVAHFSGAVAGLLVGIGVLRNLKVRPWEKKLWWFAVTLYSLLMLSGIFIHIFYTDHFYHQRWWIRRFIHVQPLAFKVNLTSIFGKMTHLLQLSSTTRLQTHFNSYFQNLNLNIDYFEFL